MGLKVGIDIGGTFTDLVLLEESTGEIATEKLLTSSGDPARAVIEGFIMLLEKSGVDPSSVIAVAHGTTLATNAIIERKGAPTGMITTEGFKDIIEIGRERRYDPYDVLIRIPDPLVPRNLRLEINERVKKDGSILLPLSEKEIVSIAEKLAKLGVQSVAVCLLHSFLNPTHELRVREIIRSEMINLEISLSSEVAPEIREYERATTTVVNAYVKPVMKQYLKSITEGLQGLGCRGEFFVMHSSGGLTTPEEAGDFPVRVIESGPTAGVIATSFWAKVKGWSRCIAFDMGGTTAKACFINSYKPSTVTESEVARVHWHQRGSGFPVRVPMIDIMEIGAGGGSIARVNEMNLIQVGPESSSADPGPACYGRGGYIPTVTDADLMLGYLNADYFLGGEMFLRTDLAEKAIIDHVGRPLGLPLHEAAEAIHNIAVENMASAIRLCAIQRGLDPSDYTLVASGGAGPVHAYQLAKRLGITKIMFPRVPGVMSALGLIISPVSFELSRGYISLLNDIDIKRVKSIFGELELQARQVIEKVGINPADIRIERKCSMSYVGQGYEIDVPLDFWEMNQSLGVELKKRFEACYSQLYGRLNPELAVRAVTWRVLASGPQKADVVLRMKGDFKKTNGEALKGTRKVFFRERSGFVVCPVYDRYLLRAGEVLAGPAIVEEGESTIVLGPDGQTSVDDYLNLVLTIEM